MKKLLCMFLLLAMLAALAGCSEKKEAPKTPAAVEQEEPAAQPSDQAPVPEPVGPKAGQFVFTRDNFPKLDGSTSTVPLAQAMAAVLLSEELEQVEDLIQFSKTTQSYRNLIWGQSDLLLAAEPAEAIWNEKADSGFEWVMEPFAIDGLIFVVSAENPVDSLTVEQVQKIYTGEYTNWSQVGGDNVPIAAFQRNAEAGSQTMMKKLVMDGLELMEPPVEYMVESMYGLMEAVKSYDDSTGAIGYSVYYYANDMRMADGLKILRIGDAEPSPETFRDGSYPFTNPYYVVMKAGLAEDDPIYILFQWVLSPEGQKLVAEKGYAAVSGTEE